VCSSDLQQVYLDGRLVRGAEAGPEDDRSRP